MLALAAAGCGTHAHDEAVRQAKRYADRHGLAGRVTCSNGIGGINPRTPDFICDVRLTPAVCDELEVRRTHGAWHVRLRRHRVDCVLPF